MHKGPAIRAKHDTRRSWMSYSLGNSGFYTRIGPSVRELAGLRRMTERNSKGLWTVNKDGELARCKYRGRGEAVEHDHAA